jgi:hypothetical protein
MMLSESILLTTTIEIMLHLDHYVALQADPDGIAIRLPTTRRLADYLGVPHYYVLPHFAEMEKTTTYSEKSALASQRHPAAPGCFFRRWERSMPKKRTPCSVTICLRSCRDGHTSSHRMTRCHNGHSRMNKTIIRSPAERRSSFLENVDGTCLERQVNGFSL